MAKRILITGGAGFIGSTIADLFVEAGWEVAVLDDLSSGRRENVPAAARFYPVDVRSAAALEAIQKERPQVLCHHAAQIDVRRSMSEPRLDADVNIGNPHELTVLQFAEAVQRLVGSACPIEHRPLPEDDPKVRRPDITRAKELLGWEPRVAFDEGMRRTIAWFRAQL